MAYDTPGNLLSAPDWTREVWLEVTAIVPAGATKESFLEMQQKLLAERLKLRVHREKKEAPAYELVIAKGGLKIKERSDAAGQADSPVAPTGSAVDAEGFPVLPAGRTSFRSMRNLSRYRAAGETMETLASLLSGHLKSPVADATGLKGKYEFTLSWLAREMPGESTTAQPLAVALAEQLGLRLERKRGEVEILVVDQLEKAPVEN